MNNEKSLHNAMLLDPHWKRQCTPEQVAVADLFLADFLKAGIHMPDRERRQFVDWNDRITALGHSFTTDPSLPAKERVRQLEEMLKLRSQLALSLGHPSYAHLYLQDKMALRPGMVEYDRRCSSQTVTDRVESFLQSLVQRNKSKALAELSKGGSGFFGRHGPSLPVASVGSVMDTVSWLFRRLYGIRLEPAEVVTGELWDPSVRKLQVIEESEGSRRKIGTIFCDLFRRPTSNGPAAAQKCHNPAQFTVRCSRRVDDDVDGAFPAEHYQDLEYIGLARGRDPAKTHHHQLPVVVLSCSFPIPSPQNPCILRWSEVETLFHEMGHALHSMVARTDYHHVAGTRCKLDFVEVPSILMEYFATHPRIRQRILSLSQGVLESTIPLTDLQAPPIPALETQQQLVYALLDQHYHSSMVRRADFDSTREYYWIQKQYHVIPSTASTLNSSNNSSTSTSTSTSTSNSNNNHHFPQTQFGHLFGYGAGYYSYVWSRTFAERVFSHSFRTALDKEDDSTLRLSGERWKDDVLALGGSRDPWTMPWETLMDGREYEMIRRY